jgi:hypothetical protein
MTAPSPPPPNERLLSPPLGTLLIFLAYLDQQFDFDFYIDYDDDDDDNKDNDDDDDSFTALYHKTRLF